MQELDTNVEFIPIELDLNHLMEERNQLIQERAKQTREHTRRIRKTFGEMLSSLSRATVPEGVTVTAAINIMGDLTVTLENLDSFHDATEVSAVFQQIFEEQNPWKDGYYRQNYPEVSEYPESRKRTIYWPNLASGGRTVLLRLLLDTEAKGCVVRKVIKAVEVPVYDTIYKKEERQVSEFLCPGEPGYDEALAASMALEDDQP